MSSTELFKDVKRKIIETLSIEDISENTIRAYAFSFVRLANLIAESRGEQLKGKDYHYITDPNLLKIGINAAVNRTDGSPSARRNMLNQPLAVCKKMLDYYTKIKPSRNNAELFKKAISLLEPAVIQIDGTLAPPVGHTMASYFDEDDLEKARKDYVPYKDLAKRTVEHVNRFNTLYDELSGHGRVVLSRAEINIVDDALAGVLNVYEPNCRGVWSTTKFVDDSQTPLGMEHPNTVYIPSNGGNAVLTINQDKVVRARGRNGAVRFELLPDTTDILRKSLDIYPRDYVLADPNDPELPMGADNHSKVLLHRAFKHGDKRPKVDAIRKSQIDHFHTFYATHHPAIQWLAHRMRHEVSTAMTWYRSSDPVNDHLKPPFKIMYLDERGAVPLPTHQAIQPPEVVAVPRASKRKRNRA